MVRLIIEGQPVEVKVIRAFESHNRRVFLVEMSGQKRVVKILAGDKRHRDRIVEYRAELEKYGIRCVPIILIFEEGNQLIEIEPAGAADWAMLLNTADDARRFEDLVYQLTETISPLFSMNSPTFPVGLDVGPRNFVDLEGKCCYVDFCPPKLYRGPNDFTLEIPEPTEPEVREMGFFRHYTPEGVALTLLTHLGIIRPELWAWEKSKELIAGTLYPKLLDFLKVIETIRLDLNLDLCQQQLQCNPPPLNHLYLVLRVLACQSAARNNKIEIARRVWMLTHFQDKQISRENLQEALSLIISASK